MALRNLTIYKTKEMISENQWIGKNGVACYYVNKNVMPHYIKTVDQNGKNKDLFE